MKRYLLVFPALALLGASPPPAPPKTAPVTTFTPQPEGCAPLDSVAQGWDRLKPQRLGELPQGRAYMAVYRTDAFGCIDPMLASERQGARPPR